MGSLPYSSYPPVLSPEQKQYLLTTIKDWCIQHGLSVRPPSAFITETADKSGVLATNAPVTLFPSPFPKVCFEQGQALQRTYNELYAAISDDDEWIGEIMRGKVLTPRWIQPRPIEVDDFIENLWKTHLAVKAEGYVQPLSLGLFRSDYMLHLCPDGAPSIQQVEFNTISASFGGLSSLVSSLHTHLLTFPDSTTHLAYPPHPLFHTNGAEQDLNLSPENNAIQVLREGLRAAHKSYGPSKSQPPLPLCVLFLVQPNERNIFDQLPLSTSTPYPTFRITPDQILTQTTIPDSNPSRPLLYTPASSPTSTFEVSTIYFRALYAPSEYTTPESWSARLHLERSAAIKCPSILTHLAGCKKIQQALTSTSPDHLARFLPTHQSATLESLRSTFAPQYDLSPDSEGLKIALDPERAVNHVLKPQREGGGNNVYKGAIPGFLKELATPELYNSYILMELIKPPTEARNTVLRSDGQIVSGGVVSELGVFGACLWRSENGEGGEDGNGGERKIGILHNEGGGYLMRTKGTDSDEGGVAAGFSSLDSVLLYDESYDEG